MTERPHYIDTASFFTRGSMRGAMGSVSVYDDEAEVRRRVEIRPLRVHDARRLARKPTIETPGFELARIAGPPQFPIGGEAAEKAFGQEARRVVQALTGCRDTKVIHRQYRTGYPGDSQGPSATAAGTRPPGDAPPVCAMEMHADVSAWAERQSDWEELSEGRHCAVFTVWRSLDFDREVLRAPLALWDVRTAMREDMVALCMLGVGNSALVTYGLVHNFFQRWCYYPRIAPDEAVVFKLYDTREERPERRQVFHGAAHDPSTPPDAPLRKSLDMRILALFDDEPEIEARRDRFIAQLPPIPDALEHHFC